MQSISSKNSCIVLGGGGARGLAHLGSINALSQEKIHADRIVGVSIGALMGTLYAVDNDPVQAIENVREFLSSKEGQKIGSNLSLGARLSTKSRGHRWGTRLFRALKRGTALARAVRRPYVVPSAVLRDIIAALVPDIDIQDLKTPIQIVTVNLETGERVVLESGSLRRAIRASMSIPGVFPPVRFGDQLLCDIGVYDSVPCDLPRPERTSTASENIIAVDVGNQPNTKECKSAFDSMLRYQALAELVIREKSLAQAHTVIRPNVGGIDWFDFSNPDTIIHAGYEAAQNALRQQDGSPKILPNVYGEHSSNISQASSNHS